MKTDYKFWYILRDDDGFITEAAVRFYEGEVSTLPEKDVRGELRDITRYRRTKRLKADDLSYLAKEVDGKLVIKGAIEKNGNFAVGYSKEDFGRIKTDDELRLFLNKELAKDQSREPVTEQCLP